MKTIFAFLAVLGVLCYSASAKEGDRCGDQNDCAATECCLMKGVLNIFTKGHCAKQAEEGEDCNHMYNQIRGKYFMHCICAEGLSCEPEEIKDLPFIGTVRINEKCISGSATTSGVGEETTPESEGQVE